MTPIVFDGCFGWFHPGATTRGVVLCAPVGEEADYVHGVLREFAEELAQSGLSTLRFDYPGLGNSLDLEQGRDSSTAWVESIKAAMLWLKTEAAIEDVAVIGMRLGAGLALRCAEEIGGLSRLVLIAPVASGTAFHRELALLARLNEGGAPLTDKMAPSEAATVFTAEKTFNVADLRYGRGGQKPAQQVLILSTNGSGAASTLGDRLEVLGVEVTQAAFQGYAALMVRPQAAIYPEVAFGKVLSWLREGAQSRAAPCGLGARPRPVAALASPGAWETPVFFRDEAPLFGMLCRPETPRDGRPGILFLNTGAVSHSGMNRIWVSMARRYAALGFTSLRFDISGVGESRRLDESADRQPNMKAAVADVEAAIGWLQAQGCSTITLIGFCWGAQLACNVALEDDRATRLIMINAPRQFWDFETEAKQPRSVNTYLRLLRDSAKWGSLRRGEISLRELSGFSAQLIFATMQSIFDLVTGVGDRSQAAIGKLRSLKARGVEAAIFHGDDDTFLSEIEDYLGVDRQGLAGLLSMHTRFFPGVHHRFADDGGLAELVQTVGDHLSRADCVLGPSTPPPQGPGHATPRDSRMMANA